MEEVKYRTCELCGTPFVVGPNSGRQKYCSKRCYLEINGQYKQARRKQAKAKAQAQVNKLDVKGETGRCKGCAYRDDQGNCDFIGRTQKTRPCPVYDGGGCDIYAPKLPNEHIILTFDENKARELWRATGERYNSLPRKRMDELTRAIAGELGCAPNSLKAWLHAGGASDAG